MQSGQASAAPLRRLVGRVFHPDWLPVSFIIGIISAGVPLFFLAICGGNTTAITAHGTCMLYSSAFLWFEIHPPNAKVDPAGVPSASQS
jgi:hypothetical protein